MWCPSHRSQTHTNVPIVLSNTSVLALSLSTMMLVHKHPMIPHVALARPCSQTQPLGPANRYCPGQPALPVCSPSQKPPRPLANTQSPATCPAKAPEGRFQAQVANFGRCRPVYPRSSAVSRSIPAPVAPATAWTCSCEAVQRQARCQL
jgi:hypothetical protein